MVFQDAKMTTKLHLWRKSLLKQQRKKGLQLLQETNQQPGECYKPQRREREEGGRVSESVLAERWEGERESERERGGERWVGRAFWKRRAYGWCEREREDRGKEETVSKQDARHYTRQHLKTPQQRRDQSIHPHGMSSVICPGMALLKLGNIWASRSLAYTAAQRGNRFRFLAASVE